MKRVSATRGHFSCRPSFMIWWKAAEKTQDLVKERRRRRHTKAKPPRESSLKMALGSGAVVRRVSRREKASVKGGGERGTVGVLSVQDRGAQCFICLQDTRGVALCVCVCVCMNTHSHGDTDQRLTLHKKKKGKSPPSSFLRPHTWNRRTRATGSCSFKTHRQTNSQ